MMSISSFRGFRSTWRLTAVILVSALANILMVLQTKDCQNRLHKLQTNVQVETQAAPVIGTMVPMDSDNVALFDRGLSFPRTRPVFLYFFDPECVFCREDCESLKMVAGILKPAMEVRLVGMRGSEHAQETFRSACAPASPLHRWPTLLDPRLGGVDLGGVPTSVVLSRGGDVRLLLAGPLAKNAGSGLAGLAERMSRTVSTYED